MYERECPIMPEVLGRIKIKRDFRGIRMRGHHFGLLASAGEAKVVRGRYSW